MSDLLELSWVVTVTDEEALYSALEVCQRLGSGYGVELRLDRWQDPVGQARRLPSVESRLGIPLIATWRRGQHDESERVRFFEQALRGEHAIDAVDLDATDLVLLREYSGAVQVQRIVSSHFAAPVGDELIESLHQEWVAGGADAVKLVLCANGADGLRQSIRLQRKLSRRSPTPTSIFTGGLEGRVTRWVAAHWGWCYGSLTSQCAIDRGQPEIDQLDRRYGATTWDGEKPLWGVLGADVRRSISPPVHRHVLAERGGGELFVDLSLEDPHGLLEALPLAGLAVTAPHKRWAREVAKAGDPSQSDCPAFNTLVKTHGEWRGFNTDGLAIVALFERRGTVSASVAILGTGGAARGVRHALEQSGYRVKCFRRDERASFATTDVLLNATGETRIEALPWDLRTFRGSLFVEMSYHGNGVGEQLAASGVEVVGGNEVFAEQARLQMRHLYGVTITPEQCQEWTDHALEPLLG